MQLVERSRVTERLQAAVAEYPLTLLVAPLGTGKSCALTLAFAGRPNVARLDLELRHQGNFVPALVTSVRGVRDGFGRNALGALASGMPAADIGATFALELQHLETPLVIVIDNIHVLDGDSTLEPFLTGLLQRLPAFVRVCLAGRVTPRIDLREAFARRQVTIIGNDVLRFTDREISNLAASMSRVLDGAAVAAIEASTDGWATAVVLTLDSSGETIPTLRSHAAASDYLDAALLPRLAPEALTFLELTSVFDTLDLKLLERSPAFHDARARLTQLVRGGALMLHLGNSRYRIQPILRELALTRLQSRGALTAAHAAAVDAYLRVNEISAALFHVVAAADAGLAAGFLRSHAVAAFATGDRARVRAAAELIDASKSDADVAALVRGLDEKAAGNPAARDSFVVAAEAATASGDVAITYRARAQVVEHDLGRLRRVDDGELRYLRKTALSLGSDAIATAAMLDGWASAIAFDFAGAAARVAPFIIAGDAGARFNTGILFAYTQTALGEFEAAAATLDSLVRLLETDDRVVLQTLALVWFARLAIAWGSMNAAADAAAHAARLAVTLDLHAEEAVLFNIRMELATHQGDGVAAVHFAQSARDRSRRAWYIADVDRIRAFAEIAAARAAFLASDHAVARSLALHVANAAKTPDPMRALALAEAAIYTLLCEPATAPGTIVDARSVARAARPVDIGDATVLAVAGDLIAFLAASNGETIDKRYPVDGPFDKFVAERRGLITLEHAGIAVANARRGLSSGEALGLAFERFTRNGPRFEARLAQAYASRFVKAQPARSVEPSAFELTPREREVLRLLVDGLSNKEIAQRVNVSPRTVETHVERILGKLEVGSRSRAIAKALRLGIVDIESAVSGP